MTRPLPLLFWTACLTLLLTFVPSPAFGADAKPPAKMAFQGFLTDQNGVARGQNAAENFEITFRLYKTATAAAPDAVWAEKQIVTVDKGHFSVVLGEGVLVSGSTDFATHFSGNDTDNGRYLGITVTGETEISPRIQFFTAPYSFVSRYATELVGSSGASVLKLGVDKVGINLVGAPSTALDVNGTVKSTGVALTGTSALELGAGVAGKQSDAGKFGYQLFTADALDIVGAGTTGANRKVKIWAEGGTTFAGPITATGFNGPGDNLTGVAKLGANTFTGYQEVQNHLRVGEVNTTIGVAGWGEALILSGAPPMQAGYNSDNSDPLWIARYNAAANSSELRMVIGDDPGSTGDKLVIGTMQGAGDFSQGANWAAKATIDARGYLGLDGRNPDYPLTFPNTLGDKISLWGNAGVAHYGFGIQNSTLQIYGDGSGSRIAFGYGSSSSFNYYGLINYDAMYVYHTSTPQLNLQRTSSGTYANMYNEGTRIVIGMTGSTHGGVNSYRYATYDGDANWDFNSDRKLKKDIVDAQPVLERALKVQIRNFRWKDGPDDARPMIGVIAQELQPLFPDMVSETENLETKEKNLSVGYGDFAVIAIKAIQELKAQHDSEVKDLQAQVADLKAQMKQVLQAAAELRGQSDKSKATAAVSK